MLKEKGPSAIEVELQNLAPEGGRSLELMAQFLRLTARCLRSKFNYELTQSYLALFLKLHRFGDLCTFFVALVQSVEFSRGLLEIWGRPYSAHAVFWPFLTPSPPLHACARILQTPL